MRIILSIFAGLLLFACNNSATKMEDPKDTAKTTKQMPAPLPVALMNDTIFTALGTEPFWAAYVIKKSKIVFENAEGLKAEFPFVYAVLMEKGDVKYSSSNDSLSLEIIINWESCSDGMSENEYHYSVKLKVNNRHYTGCGRLPKKGWCGTPNPPEILTKKYDLDSVTIF